MGDYGDLADFKCKQCETGCATCTGPSVHNCTSCLNATSPYYLHYGTTYCGTDCPDGQYKNDTSNKCLPCSSECKTCVNYATECLTCGFSQYGFHLHLHNKQCLLNCPDGYWENSTTNNCDACAQGCLTCTGGLPTECQTCGNSTNLTIFYKHIGANTCA